VRRTAGRAVYIVIGCDVDPDRASLLEGVSPAELAWRGATEGLPAVKEAVRGLTDSRGRGPVFTWFLRADDQVRQMCGTYSWFVAAHGPLLRSVQEGGDELAWHPHFWRRARANGAWIQEIADVDWQVDMLQRTHRELAAGFPGPLTSVRMGWGYHNDRTFAALENLGITADLSAVPGFRTLTGRRPAKWENLFDWRISPRAPYRPSRSDYRRPARGEERAFRLLEVPGFVSTSRMWGLVSGLQLGRKTRDVAQLWDALRRPTYCINVSGRPPFFAPLVAQLRKTLRSGEGDPVFFVTHSHADEFVPNRSPLYSLESVRANLEALLRACDAAGARAEFIPARQLPALSPN
jgi:hypothetical protein